MPDLLAEAFEDEELRTRHAKVYRNPATRKRIFEFGKHRHYKRFGSWRDVDRALYSKGSGRYMIEANDIILDADGSGLAVYDYDSGKGIRFLFPRPPDRVTGRAAFWTTAGVEWKFSLSRQGLKTEATVAAKRGPRTYNFSGQMLGGLAPPNPDQDGNLVQPAGAFTMPRSYAIGADGERYECGPWTRSGGTVSFDFDDTDLPLAALPYVIDPTTMFDVVATWDDFHIFSGLATYPPGPGASVGNSITLATQKNFSASLYRTYVGVARWDTSTLPDDALIDSAIFRGYVTSVIDTDDRSWTAEWYTHPGEPVDYSDYTDTVGTDANSGVPLAAIPVFADIDLALTGANANVSRTDYTGIRFHIDGGIPTAVNAVAFASFDHTTEQEPRLLIETEDEEKSIGLKYVRKGVTG